MSIQRVDSHLVTATNSLRIIGLFSYSQPELGVSEISKKLGLSKSIVSRILATLQEESILHRESTSGKYRLGTLLVELGLVAGMINPIVSGAEFPLKHLQEATQENSYLLIPDQYDSVCVTPSFQNSHKVGMQVRNARSSLSGSICGLTVLAMRDAPFVNQALHYAASRHLLTPDDLDRMHHIIGEIQKNEYAFHNELMTTGISTVACPVFKPDGSVAAAIAVTGPTKRFTNPKQLIHAVSKAAQQISKNLS